MAHVDNISSLLIKIGHLVLIRRQMSYVSEIKGKVGSLKLFTTLQNVNDTVMNDMKNRSRVD